MRRALIAVCASGVLLGATAGSAGAATITPTAGTDFGNVEVNTTSPAKKFTLTLGMELMFTPAISVDPPFQQSNDCGILLPGASSSCSINVTFSPSSGGPAQGTLKAGGTANTVLVTGTGVEPGGGKKCKKKKKGKKGAAAAKKKKRKKCKKGKKGKKKK